MSKTVIVSNRLPIKIRRVGEDLVFEESEGGLATGLKSIYNEGDNIWIGWPGTEIKNERERNLVYKELRKRNLIPVFLSKKEVKLFYEGFANEIIWPICHYRPSYTIFEKKSWLFYKKVNEKFKEAVEKYVEKDDFVWVHDYHLMLLPGLLRSSQPELKIGYFHHIPFPSYEIFKLIPWRTEIIHGVLGADLIGFHIKDYARHFKETCVKIAHIPEQGDGMRFDNRKIMIHDFPLGIDVQRYKKLSENIKVWQRSAIIQRNLRQSKIILSIDRLDYSKGILERIKAIELLLQQHPEYREKISFIQLIVPSRDAVRQYRILKNEIDRTVGQVNSDFATAYWTPIKYFYDSYPIEQICALYVAADVCLVTPIRDGMNLVCKEFIACNSSEESNGVLILSERAGAANELKDTFIINPSDIEQIANTLHIALHLPKEEQRAILSNLYEAILKDDVHLWVEHYMTAFKKSVEERKVISDRNIPPKIFPEYLKTYYEAGNCLFLIDYDGTLVPFASKPEDAVPDKKIIYLLNQLQEISKNQVFIISGRKKDELEKWHGGQKYGLSAEHGAWLFDQSGEWIAQYSINPKWKEEIKLIFEEAVQQISDSFIEEKDFSLVWHYRNSNQEDVLKVLPELEEKILASDSLKFHNLGVLKGDQVLEVKSKDVDKGRVAQAIIHHIQPDFIVAIGDDETDEDIFQVLPKDAISIKVGKKYSHAQYYLSDPDEVFAFLRTFI